MKLGEEGCLRILWLGTLHWTGGCGAAFSFSNTDIKIHIVTVWIASVQSCVERPQKVASLCNILETTFCHKLLQDRVDCNASASAGGGDDTCHRCNQWTGRKRIFTTSINTLRVSLSLATHPLKNGNRTQMPISCEMTINFCRHLETERMGERTGWARRKAMDRRMWCLLHPPQSVHHSSRLACYVVTRVRYGGG